METEQAAKILRQWFESWAKDDIETVLDGLSENVIFYAPQNEYNKAIPYLGKKVGRQAVKEVFAVRAQTTKLLNYELLEFIVEGNKACIISRTQEICKQTEQIFEIEDAQFIVLDEEGKISSWSFYFDPNPEIAAFTANLNTELIQAVQNNQLSVGQSLLAIGANVNIRDRNAKGHLTPLLQPFKRGNLELPNRMVMAPLTRRRADYHLAPTPLNALYYAQRASAGLIISEATQISPQGTSLPRTPGLYSPEQIAGWQLVTQAVHELGGRIFLQLWHGGRCSHPSLQPQGVLPVAPSAIAPNEEKALTATEEEVDFVVPRALLTSEIPGIIDQYRQAAKNAILSEADGVEIHGASGYLLDQFLQDNSNQRTDAYGGSIENRARLLMEVTAAVIEVWGSERVGVRLSPSSTFQDMNDSNPEALFNYVVTQLNSLNLAYLHIVEPRIKGSHDDFSVKKIELGVQHFRPLYQGTLITAGGYTRETGEAILAQGDADLVAYGRLFIANPDLPKRFALNAPLNVYDRSTFTGGNERGYLDYPFLEKSE